MMMESSEGVSSLPADQYPPDYGPWSPGEDSGQEPTAENVQPLGEAVDEDKIVDDKDK
jgi:hypothetical protein